MTITANRRKFLGAAAAGVLTGATALSAKAACRDPMPAKFDEMHDVVVVGSGFAGLSAALSAKLAGADVLVVEKMAFIGGNSSLSGGMIAVPNSSVQHEQGIEDKPEALEADMMRIGQGLGDPEPLLYAAQCFLQMKKKDEAKAGLEAVLRTGDPSDARTAECRSRAAALLELLSGAPKP